MHVIMPVNILAWGGGEGKAQELLPRAEELLIVHGGGEDSVFFRGVVTLNDAPEDGSTPRNTGTAQIELSGL